MNCPVHNKEMRVEHAHNVPRGEPFTTGFCLKCLKHYTQCWSTRHMNHCDLVMGHKPPHRAPNGQEWRETWTS